MTTGTQAPKVWRDGDRIRRLDSTGYGDMVPDEAIWKHLTEHAEARELEMVEFCAAVLALRQHEKVQRSVADWKRWDAENREAVKGMADPPHYELSDGTCVSCGEPWMCDGSLR